MCQRDSTEQRLADWKGPGQGLAESQSSNVVSQEKTHQADPEMSLGRVRACANRGSSRNSLTADTAERSSEIDIPRPRETSRWPYVAPAKGERSPQCLRAPSGFLCHVLSGLASRAQHVVGTTPRSAGRAVKCKCQPGSRSKARPFFAFESLHLSRVVPSIFSRQVGPRSVNLCFW